MIIARKNKQMLFGLPRKRQEPKIVLFAFLFILWAASAVSAQEDLITWNETAALETESPASWARMAHLKNGDWLAAYAIFGNSSESRIRVKKSSDSMRSWALLTEFGEDGRQLDNANLLLTSNGNVLLAVRSLIDKKSYRVQVYKSLDNGKTFNILSIIDANETPNGAANVGLWEPFLIEFEPNKIAVFYASEKYSKAVPPFSQIIAEKVSTDGGKTWGAEIRVVAEPGASRPGEPNVLKLSGKSYALFYEVCGTEDCAGHFSVSKNGIDWLSKIGALIPNVFQNPQAGFLDEKTFFVTSNNAKIIFTRDAGKSWQLNTPAFNFSSWGAFYQTKKDEIALVTGTRKSEKDRNQLLIRFGKINLPTR